jgi:hypothetical protein
MRQVTIRATWQSTHTLEVSDDAPRFSSDDLEGVLAASDDDITSATAELVDWEVKDYW